MQLHISRRVIAALACLAVTVSTFAAPPRKAPGGSGKPPPTGDAGGGPDIPVQDTKKPDKVVNYQKATPEEAARAIADAQKVAKEVGRMLEVELKEMQTDHFILFTDWDPREFKFLQRNLEAAYTAVSRQFEMSPRDNIFVGKLPVFMFARQSKFIEYADKVDGFKAPRTVAGYYSDRGNGFGHMVMWKPDVAAAGGNVSAAERQWAYVLTHEFTHAFVARYRSNRPMPRWLNEGTAEVVANGEFPRPDAFRFAKMMAQGNRRVHDIFDDERMPPGEMYPVMMTMVQALARENPRKFLKYFNALKDGGDPEQTLRDMYGVDYTGLEAAWRKYMKVANR